jgi:hypothetical protein
MARATTSAPGMPKAKTILAEKVFTPPRAITSAKAAVEAPKYRIIITNQVDAYDAPLAADEISTFGMKRLPPGDNFAGTSRKAAKLSIAEATTEVFKDIKDLIKSLVSDKTMAKRKPPIATTAGSNRVAEEKRNVRVRAFLYAASREDDNDFHLIIGRAPRSSPMYMTRPAAEKRQEFRHPEEGARCLQGFLWRRSAWPIVSLLPAPRSRSRRKAPCSST